MKKVYLLLVLLTSMTFGQTPVLTAIVDGTCSGGLPKMIEIYAQGTVDFTQFTLERQANGGGFTSSLDLSPLGTITDDYVYLYNNGSTEADFLTEFPSATGKTLLADSFISGNGDDAFRIVDASSNVVDIFGVENEDGSGMAWDYLDSYAKRNTGAAASATFDASQWTFGGANFLDGKGACNGGNDFETEMGGIQTYYQAPAPVATGVIIGEGTEVNKQLPIEPYYGYSYSQVIYLASEINASGDITELTWDFAGTELDDSNEWTIYMGHTNKTEFSSDTDWIDVSTLTQVFTGTISINADNKVVVDIADFNYNGTDNLVIAVDENKDSYDSSSNDFYCTAVPDNRGIEYHSDSNNPDPAAPPTGNLKTYIANIVLGGIVQNCPNPSGLAVTDVRPDTADVSWADNTGGSATYTIEWREVGAAAWNSATTAAGATAYQFTGLTPQTEYEWQLTADCGGGDTSGTISGTNFTTLDACPEPTDLLVSNPTTDSVDLSWADHSSGSSATYIVEWKELGAATWNSATTAAGATSYQLTGLTPSTTYEWQLTTDCGGGTTASPVAGPMFSTACITVDTFPYTYGFENVTSNSGGDWTTSCWSGNPENTGAGTSSGPYRWTVTDGSTPSSSTGPSGAYEGTQYAYTEASGSNLGDVAELISPNFDLSSLTAPSLSFYYYMYGDDIGSLSVDTFDGTTWTNDVFTLSGPQQPDDASPWIKVYVDLTTNVTQIRFRAIRGDGYKSDIAIDLISIDEAPTCMEASDLLVSNITTDSVDLSWTDNSGGTATYTVEWRELGATAWNSDTTAAGATSYQLTGLNSYTEYEWQLTTNCTNGTSNPMLGINFITLPDYCAGDHFYDAGGPNDNYPNGLDETTVIAPDNPGDIVTVTFLSFNTENNYDHLYVYDGPDDTYPQLADLTGDLNANLPGPFTSTDASGALTFVFHSDGSATREGWDAEVVCMPPPTCPAPTDLAVSNIQFDSAELTWTDNTSGSASYIVEWKEAGAAAWNSDTTAAGATSYQLTGLTSGTNYEWQLTADCGGGDTSSVAVGDAFATYCDAVAMPWSESFEDPFNFECWQNTGSGSYVWEVNDGSSHGPGSVTDGTQAIMFDVYSAPSGSTASAVTPVINMDNYTDINLSFDYWMNGSADTNLWLKVEMSTDFGVTWNEIFYQEQDGTISDWTSVSVPLTGTTSATLLKFTASSDYGLYNIFVDNVVVDGTSSINSLEAYNFNFYPNPVQNNLNISADKNINSLQIFDILGQEVLSTEINKAQYLLDTHQLRAGTYILKVDIDNHTGYYRFVKK